MISEKELTRTVGRILSIPTAQGDNGSLETRAAEYKRILRAGLRDDSDLTEIANEVMEACKWMPAPAVLMAMVQTYNRAQVERRRQESAEAERRKWPDQYGPPKPISVNPDACLCGKPWKEILAEIRESYRRMNEFLAHEKKSDWDLAKRALGIRWHHETCAERPRAYL